MLVMIGTACICSFKSNYHAITTTTDPTIINIFTYRNTSLHVTTNETDSHQNESQYDEIDSISYQSVTWRHYTLDDSVSVHHSSASETKLSIIQLLVKTKQSTIQLPVTTKQSTIQLPVTTKQSTIQLPVTTKLSSIQLPLTTNQ